MVQLKNASGPYNPSTVWVGPGYRPQDLAILGDSDANGVPEVAVLSTRLGDGRVLVERKNATGAANKSTTWFSDGHEALSLKGLPDSDGDGTDEVAVLMRRLNDGRAIVEIKNSIGPTNPAYHYGLKGYAPVGLGLMPDTDGTGYRDIALLMERDTDRRFVSQLRNIRGDALRREIWLSK
jgi:hypothetical protein